MTARSAPAAAVTAPGPAVHVPRGDRKLHLEPTAGEPDPQELTRDELAAYLCRVSTVTVWPFAGQLLGLSRPAAYRAAVAGDIRCLSFGRRRVVPSAWLARVLLLDEEIP